MCTCMSSFWESGIAVVSLLTLLVSILCYQSNLLYLLWVWSIGDVSSYLARPTRAWRKNNNVSHLHLAIRNHRNVAKMAEFKQRSIVLRVTGSSAHYLHSLEVTYKMCIRVNANETIVMVQTLMSQRNNDKLLMGAIVHKSYRHTAQPSYYIK